MSKSIISGFSSNQRIHSPHNLPIQTGPMIEAPKLKLPQLDLSLSKTKTSFKPNPKLNLGNVMSAVSALSSLTGPLGKKDNSNLTAGLNTAYDAASNAVMAIPGIGTIIGGAMKVGGLADDALKGLGVGTDQMTTKDKILDSKFLSLTPLGLMNALGAKKTKGMNIDSDVSRSTGYAGTMGDINSAKDTASKKYGLFSRKQLKSANRNISNQSFNQSNIKSVLSDQENRSNRLLSLDTNSSRRNFIPNFQVAIGRSGLKFVDVKSLRNKINPSDNPNVIVDGDLHARKHGIDVEGISEKGVPVILENGGEITQVAEVEREEIIFNKDVTNKLEELYKKGDEESMIEAGKLLAHEIMNNTVDKTNLIDKVE